MSEDGSRNHLVLETPILVMVERTWKFGALVLFPNFPTSELPNYRSPFSVFRLPFKVSAQQTSAPPGTSPGGWFPH